ncbi:hypothetical protein SAY86_023299 [Trapa natans]|uniref:Uncharacterized protein n=1 Tax=Trapa natans TaxID=22666 RepID=A0AAN7LVK4_TRANT|nr:hypothetical protein SAY86_023299 [Trapa natans]
MFPRYRAESVFQENVFCIVELQDNSQFQFPSLIFHRAQVQLPPLMALASPVCCLLKSSRPSPLAIYRTPPSPLLHYHRSSPVLRSAKSKFLVIECCSSSPSSQILRTCKNCKSQFDPLLNNPRACRFHTAHFGGETRRKFESVYTGGTMNTPNSGEVFQYWHCCGSEDPFDPGCTSAPHASYDD